MELRLARMPFGAYLGAVAIAVTVGDEDEEAAKGLAEAIVPLLDHGVACFHLKAPWSSPWWKQALWEAQRYEAVAAFGRPWVAVHRLDEPYAAGDVHWAMDASHLLTEREVTVSALAAAMAAHAGTFPRMPDLILREPLRPNVDPVLLDTIYRFVRPERPGQILVPAAAVDDGMLFALSRCETPWVLVTT